MNNKELIKEEPIRLLSVEIENFKRISYAEFSIDSNYVELGGKNEAGKSSVIEAVTSTLGYKHRQSPEPIQKNRKYSRCTLVFNQFVVTKRISKDGNASLIVKDSKSNKPIKSPQGFLDALQSPIIIDPAAFSQDYTNKQRLEILYEITGLRGEIEKLDIDKINFYDQRTEVNREISNLKGKLSGFQEKVEDEIELKSSSELMAKLKEAQEEDSKIESMGITINACTTKILESQREIDNGEKNIVIYNRQIKEIQGNIKQEKDNIQYSKEVIDEANATIHKLKSDIEHAPPSKTPEIEKEIETVDDYNSNARSIKERNKIRLDTSDLKLDSQKLTKLIENISDKKIDILAGANLPEGLTIENGDIMVNNLPWDNQSTSQALKMAMKIGNLDSSEMKIMALNWNNLDKESRQMILDFITENDYIAFIETVCEEQKEGMIFLEKGEIKKENK